MKKYVAYEQLNPHRAPDWRAQRVESLVTRLPLPARCTARDDAWVRRGRSFLCRWLPASDEERERVQFEQPGLAYAYAIHERRSTHPMPALCIEARLLAGQPFDQIARELSTIPDTIASYEALFFNVTDRLQNRDWIIAEILLPSFLRQADKHELARIHDNEALRGRHGYFDQVIPVALPFMDGSLKYFSYFGGPLLTDIMIHGLRSGIRPATPEDMARWVDETWATIVRRRSLMTAELVEVTKYNAMQLLDAHARVIEVAMGGIKNSTDRSTLQKHISLFLQDLPWRAASKPFVRTPGEAVSPAQEPACGAARTPTTIG